MKWLALTLEDIDWRHDRLAVPGRKAGHSTAFPLATSVGEALVDRLQNGRPDCEDRHVFMRAVAPIRPIGPAAVSSMARACLLRAGIDVPRPGSHTLRHSAVQRLVDAKFPLKVIGDFIGHRSARSTEVYEPRWTSNQSATSRWKPIRAVVSAPERPRSSSITTTRALGHARATAGSAN